MAETYSKVGTSQQAGSQHMTEHGSRISDFLLTLYEPTPPNTAQIDIFFFHGFALESGSHSFLSPWRRGNASQELWPKTFLSSQYPDARIIVVSYDACMKKTDTQGTMDLYLIGERLLLEFCIARNGPGQDCPMILVGHCFGGIVIKQLCLHAYGKKESDANASDVITFLERIRGIFFYGTPHSGMEGILSRKEVMGANKPLLDFATILSKDAARLHQEFEKKWILYRWKIYGVGETHAPAGACTPLVPEASSRFGDVFTMVERDHFSISRPVSKACITYLQLVQLIDTVYGEKRQRKRAVDERIVGVDSFLSGIIHKHLHDNTFVGFYGMGGVGKTTLAKLAFEEVRESFECTCFIEDFKFLDGNKNNLREQIWGMMQVESTRSSIPNAIVGKRSEGIWLPLSGKKLLVVLDDISKDEHVDLLVEIAKMNARKESRFIATSRDKRLLEILDVYGQTHTCEIPLLEHEDAQKLFTSYAFRKGEELSPKWEGIVEEVVRGCSGLPLTLEILGKYLRSTRDEMIWAEIPTTLRAADSVDYLEGVWAKLRVSYEALGEPEKNMFLDAVWVYSLDDSCFNLEQLKAVWSSKSYGSVQQRWRTLIDRAFIKEVKNKSKGFVRRGEIQEGFQIHEHLRSMANKIASDSRRSLTYNEKAFMSNSPTIINLEKVETFAADIPSTDEDWRVRDYTQLDCSDWHPCCLCNVQKSLSELKNARYLHACFNSFCCERCVRTGGLFLPTSLVMVHWKGAGSLVRFASRSPGWKILLDSVLKLSRLSQLASKPPSWTNLLVLKLDIHGDWPRDLSSPTIWRCLAALESLSIQYRDGKLRCLPIAYEELQKLRHLEIHGGLEEVPNSLGCLRCLEHMRLANTWGNNSLSFPDAVGNLSRLRRLELYSFTFETLPMTFGNLGSLQFLQISACYRLEGLPEFGRLTKLERLCIEASNLHSLPSTFGCLTSLQYLELSGLTKLRELPETFTELRRLEYLKIVGLSICVEMPEAFGRFGSLKHLEISNWGFTMPESFCSLSNLERLHLGYCGSLEAFPESFGSLSNLKRLEISYCDILRKLPRTFGNLRSLEYLVIRHCPEMSELPDTFRQLVKLEHFALLCCPQISFHDVGSHELISLKHLERCSCRIPSDCTMRWRCHCSPLYPE